MPKSLWSAVPAAKEQNVRNFWDGDEIVFSPKVSAQVETDGEDTYDGPFADRDFDAYAEAVARMKD